MSWINLNREIPITNPQFHKIICGLVFNCPSSIEHKVKIGVNAKGKAKYKRIHKPVSARGVSFRDREINKDLFVTILTQIRRPLNITKTYALIEQSESVEQTIESIMNASALQDPYYEIVV